MVTLVLLSSLLPGHSLPTRAWELLDHSRVVSSLIWELNDPFQTFTSLGSDTIAILRSARASLYLGGLLKCDLLAVVKSHKHSHKYSNLYQIFAT